MTGFTTPTAKLISKAEKQRFSQAVTVLLDIDVDYEGLLKAGEHFGWPDEFTKLVAAQHLKRIDLKWKTDEDYKRELAEMGVA